MKNKPDQNIKKPVKEGDTMNAYAIKPILPFITSRPLTKTPLSDLNKEISAFIESHDFSFQVDKETNDLKINIKDKKE